MCIGSSLAATISCVNRLGIFAIDTILGIQRHLQYQYRDPSTPSPGGLNLPEATASAWYLKPGDLIVECAETAEITSPFCDWLSELAGPADPDTALSYNDDVVQAVTVMGQDVIKP